MSKIKIKILKFLLKKIENFINSRVFLKITLYFGPTVEKILKKYFKALYNIEYHWSSKLVNLTWAHLRAYEVFKTHNFAKILGNSKKISLIFPYFKKEKEMLNAIKSLKEQNFNNEFQYNDFEIIVINDGDKHSNVEKELTNEVIYIYRNKFNYGISRSRNLGAKISSGRLLVFVDPDLIFPSDYCHTVYKEYLKYGKNIIITGYIEDYFYKNFPDPREAFGVWENPNRITKRFYHLAGGHMAIDRNIFFESGGFDEDLIYGGVEDVYYGSKLGEMENLGVVYSTMMRVKHVPHKISYAHHDELKTLKLTALKKPKFYYDFFLNNER
jgi:glycosyltransferase involved in cell wall biosynthesis